MRIIFKVSKKQICEKTLKIKIEKILPEEFHNFFYVDKEGKYITVAFRTPKLPLRKNDEWDKRRKLHDEKNKRFEQLVETTIFHPSLKLLIKN